LSSTGGNQRPIANAGNDIVLEDTDGNGFEEATLSGLNSVDLDGNIISYVWSENGLEIANGPEATVSLSVGIHTIVLTVTDNGEATATDTVIVTVESASVVVCPDNLANGDSTIVLPSRSSVGGIDNVTGTDTDTNGSPCALVVSNDDAGQPWGRYRISILLSDYGIGAGDEMFVGVDGKSVTG